MFFSGISLLTYPPFFCAEGGDSSSPWNYGNLFQSKIALQPKYSLNHHEKTVEISGSCGSRYEN
jgi:hypothetical protein